MRQRRTHEQIRIKSDQVEVNKRIEVVPPAAESVWAQHTGRYSSRSFLFHLSPVGKFTAFPLGITQASHPVIIKLYLVFWLSCASFSHIAPASMLVCHAGKLISVSASSLKEVKSCLLTLRCFLEWNGFIILPELHVDTVSFLSFEQIFYEKTVRNWLLLHFCHLTAGTAAAALQTFYIPDLKWCILSALVTKSGSYQPQRDDR